MITLHHWAINLLQVHMHTFFSFSDVRIFFFVGTFFIACIQRLQCLIGPRSNRCNNTLRFEGACFVNFVIYLAILSKLCISFETNQFTMVVLLHTHHRKDGFMQFYEFIVQSVSQQCQLFLVNHPLRISKFTQQLLIVSVNQLL